MGRFKIIGCFAVWLCVTACSVSYGFTGGVVDYATTKTVTINDFPNQAPLVVPTLAQEFTEGVKDLFIRRTKLQMVPNNGDIEIEGEITGYSTAPMAIKEDAISSLTRLTMTVRIRYTNKAHPEKGTVENSFSAFREFDSNVMLQEAQDANNPDLIKEIAEQIFNSTIADW